MHANSAYLGDSVWFGIDRKDESVYQAIQGASKFPNYFIVPDPAYRHNQRVDKDELYEKINEMGILGLVIPTTAFIGIITSSQRFKGHRNLEDLMPRVQEALFELVPEHRPASGTEGIDFSATSVSYSPVHAAEIGVGDCYQKASLLAAMYRALGRPAQVVGNQTFNPEREGYGQEHYWVEVLDDKGNWTSQDTIPGNHPLRKIRFWWKSRHGKIICAEKKGLLTNKEERFLRKEARRMIRKNPNFEAVFR